MHGISDAQARKLMEEKSKTGQVQMAALKSGMHRNTAMKYLNSGKLPSEMLKERTWRTRKDPFERVWESEIESRLVEASELEAKTLFKHLVSISEPEEYEPGQLMPSGRSAHAATSSCSSGSRCPASPGDPGHTRGGRVGNRQYLRPRGEGCRRRRKRSLGRPGSSPRRRHGR